MSRVPLPVWTAHRICPLCESTCGLEMTLSGERVLEVRGHAEDVFSRGYLCPKGANLGRLDEDPDRLTGPLVRRDGELVPATWDEAFVVVDRELGRVRARYGDAAVALYKGNPSAHTLAATPYLRPLVQALRTPNLYSASTADQVPTQVACGLVYGSAVAVPVPDLDRTGYLVMVGANPAESNGSLCTAPDFTGRLRAIQARGGRVVVVDPRRTKTAEAADRHLPVRPATDAYLLFAFVQTLFAEGLVDLGVARGRVHGLDELRVLAEEFTPEVVADVCGIPADTIRTVARELAEAPAAAVYGRMGTCTAEYATVTNWLIQVVNILTGNLDRPGGVMYPRNPIRPTYLPERPFGMGGRHSRVRGLPEVLGEFPVATLAEEIATPGDGQVKALITIAGNPALSAPNGRRLGEALSELDFMVSVDPYLNETTSHADVILPPPRTLHAGHFDWALSSFMVRAVVRYSRPVLELTPGRPDEAEILSRLAVIARGEGPRGDAAALRESLVTKMLANAVRIPESPVFGRDPAELRAALAGTSEVERHLEVMLRLGPFGDGFGADPGGVTLQDLLVHPEGIDRGPMEPRLAEVVAHTDGMLTLCPEPVVPEVRRLLGELSAERPEFVLIGRRTLRSNNSWMHNVGNLVTGPERCTLQINTSDADRLGIARGDEVKVRSATGVVVAVAEPTDEIRRGVLSLPHGWGHRAAGTRLRTAEKVGGVSANDLTDASVIDVLSGNAVFNGVPVTLD